MGRREFLKLAIAVAAWPFGARAQQSKRVPRIGLLLPAQIPSEVDEFRAGLRELGWVEGQTIQFEIRSAAGDEARLPALAAELVNMNVDVLVTSGSGVFPVRRATSVIPTVVLVAPDLFTLGAASLAHPGGNLTGQTFFLPQLVAKRLEYLKALSPSLTHAGVALFRSSEANADVMRVLSAAAAKLNVELRPIELGGANEFAGAFPQSPSEPIGGFVATDHHLFLANADEISAIALERGLPWIGAPYVAAHGALMGYGVEFSEMYRRAAVFVDKILRGADPGDIPIEQATQFHTIVNLRTAKALKLEIPANVLVSADEVIE